MPVAIEGADTATIECGTTLRGWSITLAPVGGAFGSGSAVVSARSVDTPHWIVPASATRTVRMFWGHR